MRGLVRWIAIVVAGAVCLCLVAVGSFVATVHVSAAALTPPTPPLLKGARAASGWDSGGCPPHSKYPSRFETPDREARSSDVEDRLDRQFPRGTPEQQLISALQQQGFELFTPCDNDVQIHRALFRQTGGGFYGPYPVFANIAWKVNDRGQIIWTKAFIAYTGP